MKHTPTLLAALAGLALVSSASAATRYITTTIVVPAGQTLDFGGDTIKASGLGDGSDAENQKPIIRLNAGSTARNGIIAAPGADGCHYYGNGTLSAITWQDVGEDATTVKSGGTCLLTGSSGTNAADKFGQINAAATWTFQNVRVNTCGKVIRQNGGTTFTARLYYNGVTATRCKEAVGRTDSSSTRFYYRNVSTPSFTGSRGWWYGRDSQASAY
jgi:pectate lyase C